MANRFLGEVTTEVEGVTYTLRMDINAMCEFEEATGVEALVAFADAEGGKATIPMLRHMVHASLKRYHSDAGIEVAGDIISEDPGAIQRLMAAVAPAEEASTPGKRKAGGKRPA